ncbi:MAG TPA: cystathionine gamma-synthase [Actinomycetota bacterium]|nr:cystathionine gamma-synthase [Actinomycetota bacterium]
MRFETKAIHAGQDPEPAYGAVNVPIYQTSTFAQPDVATPRGYEYARTGNPTRTALEEALGALEGGRALCFSSGMAAESTFLSLFEPGDHVVLADDVYGGTYRLLSQVTNRWNLAFDVVDLSDLDALGGAIRDTTKLVWVETPTNPTMKIVDIAAVARLARDRGARCVVDNTFASPYLQRPLELGADAVVHSTTKYLGGHSDAIGGAVVVAADDAATYDRLAFLQNAVGAVPGPMDCFLVLRGVKTLALRMQAHCRGAEAIAEVLEDHPNVDRVYYPGLATHPGHEVASRQMSGFGGMVSFEALTEELALDVCRRTKLFALAESLGGVESLIEHPARMTHLSVAGSALAVSPRLVRLSVGIEHPDDLIDDLRRALDAAGGA